MVVTGGQRNDGAILEQVLDDIYLPRVGRGRPRTRPDTVAADKAYATGVNRELLRSQGITAVIPEKSTQINSRKKRGSKGGRPPAFDAQAHQNRNVVERCFAWTKQWRGLATRYDKLAITYRAGVLLNAILSWLQRI